MYCRLYIPHNWDTSWTDSCRVCQKVNWPLLWLTVRVTGEWDMYTFDSDTERVSEKWFLIVWVTRMGWDRLRLWFNIGNTWFPQETYFLIEHLWFNKSLFLRWYVNTLFVYRYIPGYSLWSSLFRSLVYSYTGYGKTISNIKRSNSSFLGKNFGTEHRITVLRRVGGNPYRSSSTSLKKRVEHQLIRLCLL